MVVARFRPEHDVKRLPWAFADCTPSLRGVPVDAYAVYAATAFLESEDRVRTTDEDEGLLGPFVCTGVHPVFSLLVRLTLSRTWNRTTWVISWLLMPPCRDSLLWCRFATVDELEHRLPPLHPADFSVPERDDAVH